MKPGNCLILDEPTNHLDIKSKEVLQDAINTFDGTVILVSHDRAFLDGVVNKVLEVAPGSSDALRTSNARHGRSHALQCLRIRSPTRSNDLCRSIQGPTKRPRTGARLGAMPSGNDKPFKALAPQTQMESHASGIALPPVCHCVRNDLCRKSTPPSHTQADALPFRIRKKGDSSSRLF